MWFVEKNACVKDIIPYTEGQPEKIIAVLVLAGVEIFGTTLLQAK